MTQVGGDDMPKMDPNALSGIERSQMSPSALSTGLWDVLSHSISTRAKVEGFNAETGEYRVVLQGTLDLDETSKKKP
jgi:hypothetical protein